MVGRETEARMGSDEWREKQKQRQRELRDAFKASPRAQALKAAAKVQRRAIYDAHKQRQKERADQQKQAERKARADTIVKLVRPADAE
jgi:hypothetical protein